MPTVRLPHEFDPRPYQRPLFAAWERGFRRFVTVWHRRAGKDLTWLNFTVCRAVERVGAYFYVFPTYAQGKKILWEGRDREGKSFLSHIPGALLAKKNDSELSITLVNGSTIRVIGADNPDSIVGTNPVGLVLSEYSLQKPTVWDLLRPILAENGGWAGFNFTPRGMNHAYDLHEMAQGNPEWWVSRLSVEDTQAVPLKVITSEREAGMSEEMVQQEFYVSFEAGQTGAYYGEQMRQAEADGRIGSVPWEQRAKVYTAWDLGMDDATAIWFLQAVGKERRVIDYYEASGEPLSHYTKVLSEKPYTYETHYLPHDVAVREMGTGKSRLETLRELGLRAEVVKQHEVADGIEQVRQFLGACWFDRKRCADGLQALRSYHKEYDETRKTYKARPEHDWSSHAADSFRYLAMGFVPPVTPSKTPVYREGEDYSHAGY